jgi:molecular chaperone GrpE
MAAVGGFFNKSVSQPSSDQIMTEETLHDADAPENAEGDTEDLDQANSQVEDDGTEVEVKVKTGHDDNVEKEGEESEPEEELDPLEKAEREATEWRERAMRTQAELENFRKRMTRERGEAIQYANARLFESLLPILDNFEMGLKAAKNESEESMIFQGMNMVFRQVQDFLQDNGVTSLEPKGEVFDPNLHEAVEQQFSDEVEEGRIIAVLRRGFRLNERLLRAANVIVSKGVGSDDASNGGDQAGEGGGDA